MPSVDGAPLVVRFTAPREVDVVPYDRAPLGRGEVRVRTLVSGISTGTELTAYRGSNVYLRKQWDADRRLFVRGEQTFAYPVSGWGYSEVGEVVELGPGVEGTSDARLDGQLDRNGQPAGPLAVGDVVFSVWGHRSEAVLPAAGLAGRRMPPDLDPLAGVFARVGAISLNAVLAADVHLGEIGLVTGQGVLGLLCTRLATLSGARMVVVDALAPRLALARRMGARLVVDATQAGVAEAVKAVSEGSGADFAIEISGAYAALNEAVRSVAVGGRVVAAGFYQGGGSAIDLGQEFHHNRVRIVASQIGGVPAGVADRWSVERLHRAFMGQVIDGALDVLPLVTHVLPVAEAAEAYRLLDSGAPDALQVVLDFRPGAVREVRPLPVGAAAS